MADGTDGNEHCEPRMPRIRHEWHEGRRSCSPEGIRGKKPDPPSGNDAGPRLASAATAVNDGGKRDARPTIRTGTATERRGYKDGRRTVVQKPDPPRGSDAREDGVAKKVFLQTNPSLTKPVWKNFKNEPKTNPNDGVVGGAPEGGWEAEMGVGRWKYPSP